MIRSPQNLDARTLALHQLVAAKIRRDPALFLKVKSTLTRWRTVVCPSSRPYLAEWEQLVNQGIDVTLAMAIDPSERAATLRQSSPFAGILTHQERFAFLQDWSQRHDPHAA